MEEFLRDVLAGQDAFYVYAAAATSLFVVWTALLVILVRRARRRDGFLPSWMPVTALASAICVIIAPAVLLRPVLADTRQCTEVAVPLQVDEINATVSVRKCRARLIGGAWEPWRLESELVVVEEDR